MNYSMKSMKARLNELSVEEAYSRKALTNAKDSEDLGLAAIEQSKLDDILWEKNFLTDHCRMVEASKLNPMDIVRKIINLVKTY